MASYHNHLSNHVIDYQGEQIQFLRVMLILFGNSLDIHDLALLSFAQQHAQENQSDHICIQMELPVAEAILQSCRKKYKLQNQYYLTLFLLHCTYFSATQQNSGTRMVYANI